MTFAEHVNAFNRELTFTGKLPPGIKVMNPFRDSDHALEVSTRFYNKYYSDHQNRHLILGINPGRFGSGVTGVAFTDPKRLHQECGIPFPGPDTHEPSSVFIYEMIAAFGGPEAFYRQFYINSVCPLGFTQTNSRGNAVNYNYYDDPLLQAAALPFIVETIPKQVGFGIHTNTCYCFGTGKNEKFLCKLNDQHGFFENVIALEHPRYIMQYKNTSRHLYIEKYLAAFNQVL